MVTNTSLISSIHFMRSTAIHHTILAKAGLGSGVHYNHHRYIEM